MAIETGALVALSNDLVATVDRVATSVVAVEGRARVGSSGFFIRPDLIATAEHALETDDVEVVRADGETERATVAGRDPSIDLALLRVQRAGTPVELAPSDALRVGALVLAVGRDDDGDLAASMGVLSAVGAAWRTWHGGEIDRFVRPGLDLYARFAGSPLVDVTGRVLGFNTGALARRQTLTVPSETLQRAADELLARGGRMRRGYLGVALHPVEGGAIVLGVAPNGPAARAGVLIGDVIAAIDGDSIEDADDVHARLNARSVGTSVELHVRRAGAAVTVGVTVGERPERE